MAWAEAVLLRLERSMSLFRELVEELPESALAQELPGLRSNSLGAQLWCVIGARESYARALAAGSWQGFRCSLSGPGAHRKTDLGEALAASEQAVREALGARAEFDDARQGLALDLLEHEAVHQGQLIRYLYGLRLPIPAGWRARYALVE